MNFKQFGSLLPDNPLCGISTYKDTLNLATGVCTRKIKKYVFTGEERGTIYSTATSRKGIEITGITGIIGGNADIAILAICTHYQPNTRTALYRNTDNGISNAYQNNSIIFYDTNCQTVEAFQQFCTQQYTAGTPVCIWYVLSTPTTETITIPSGLSGTEEGYLIQDGTPTPTNPIYPTANTVEKWFDSPHYIMGTDTDTITTLPADIYANDTSVTVGLKGNMEQSGTPSPTTSIQPQETGERTGNLFDGNYVNAYLTAEGIYGYPDNTTKSIIVKCEPNTTYTIKQITYVSSRHKWRIAVFDSIPTNNAQGTILVNDDSLSESTITTLNDSAYIVVYYMYPTPLVNANFMINLGSTPLPYEPYGIKIPILSNSVTTPVYLGEVESTRKIRELVLTGQESWESSSTSEQRQVCYLTKDDIKLGVTGKSTHINWKSTYDADEYNRIVVARSGDHTLLYLSLAITYVGSTLATFKQYLQQQYAAGTPVCVWYVLETETTGIVNEPLRKIGDYADEVSNVTIPTIAGANTLSVDTTLQPSEVTVNYKGWHPVADVHERENDAWD